MDLANNYIYITQISDYPHWPSDAMVVFFFLQPSLTNFPPSHLLGGSLLITLHEGPLLVKVMLWLNWKILSPW